MTTVKLAAIVLAASLSARTLAASAGSSASRVPRLVWRVPKGGGYRVLLPPSWRFADASYPSDHATHLWYDRANALRKLEVVLSGCLGCVEKNFDAHRPDPLAMVPHGATKVRRLSPWKARFTSFTLDDPYPESGVVVVLDRGDNVAGSATAEVWLPPSEHATAAAILASFRPTP